METKKRSDRRVKYTKAILKESLVKLLQGKPIDKVSVKELCEAADINRSTFYAHYRDPYDLLQQTEQDLLADLNDYLGDLYDTETEAESLEILNRIFEYIVANASICKVLLGEHGDADFVKDIVMIVQRRTLKDWEGNLGAGAGAFEYSLIFAVYGSIGVIRQWLRNDLDKTAAEMSNVIMELTYRGLSLYAR